MWESYENLTIFQRIFEQTNKSSMKMTMREVKREREQRRWKKKLKEIKWMILLHIQILVCRQLNGLWRVFILPEEEKKSRSVCECVDKIWHKIIIFIGVKPPEYIMRFIVAIYVKLCSFSCQSVHLVDNISFAISLMVFFSFFNCVFKFRIRSFFSFGDIIALFWIDYV